jgi:para-aminobenzoate synthetase component 1
LSNTVNPRKKQVFSVTVNDELIRQCLQWANRFRYFNYFSPQNFTRYPYGAFEHRLFATDQIPFTLNDSKDLKRFRHYFNTKKDWYVGFLNYNLAHTLWKTPLSGFKHISHPALSFYRPEIIVEFRSHELIIEARNPEESFEQIRSENPLEAITVEIPPLQPLTSRDAYLNNVQKIRDHILKGDFYEMNYCMEFLSGPTTADPVSLFLNLAEKTRNPFTALQKYDAVYTLCFSPERFMKKQGNKIISQPIKGTIRRDADERMNQLLQEQLLNSEKERAENLMIVDLVRNDLNRTAETGSVKVEELFGIYGFRNVNQMISTVTSELSGEYHLLDALLQAFPMGSMTGAPKIRVMEAIDAYENFTRDLFSGTIGYIKPNGDFDFNVVIRTIFLDLANKNMSVRAGSAITYDSIPEEEYEECMLKVKSFTFADLQF